MTLVASPVPALAAVSAPRERSVAWRSPARDLWVGTGSDGAYLGMIERLDAHFTAVDGSGHPVGLHYTLGEAERALVAAAESAPATLPPSTRIAIVVAAVSGLAAVATEVAGMSTLAL